MTSTPIGSSDVEKQAAGALSFADHQHHHGHHKSPQVHRARDRIRAFLHPDGKRIHVAHNALEAEELRKKLEQVHKEEEFDIYISGTPEHLEALRRAQSHHDERLQEFREQHGELYERFESVRSELDALSTELDRVTSHGVSLEAHFSKYGYGAHIRSYDEESPAASGYGTPRSLSQHEERRQSDPGRSAAERGYATPLKLFKRPMLRQYFHKGILWRGSNSEEVMSYELFADLLYVGILSVNGDSASESATGYSLLQFVVTFTLSWKIFNDMSLIISWFETDDIFSRICVLFLLVCLFGYTTNIVSSFDSTLPTLIGFYLAARLFMASYLLSMAFTIPMIRPVMFYQVIVCLIGAALWIGSIHVEYPSRLALIFIAISLDIVGTVGYVFLLIACTRIGGKAEEWFHRVFQFWPAINIEHRTERMNSLVTLVFGYLVVAILYQTTQNGITAFFGKAVLGLLQAFCFNWLYFEIDGCSLQVHAIRRSKWSALLWTMGHLPFTMSFILGGGALARLVLATDTPNSSKDDLTAAYAARSETEIRTGIRWFYCAGFGVALICMAIISISHEHKEVMGLRLKKQWRLAIRAAVALVLICLPLAESLNSLQLVGIVSGLIVFTLGTELCGASSSGQSFWQRDKPCSYIGHCGKQDLKALVEGGKEIKVEDLATEKGKKSGHMVGP